MVNVKPTDLIANKWKSRASGATQDYVNGVTSPKADWKEQTSAAAPAYNSGVQAAISRGAFAKGVNAAGTAAWQSGALSKGKDRYAGGITASADKYTAKIAKVVGVLQGIKLGARGARGDASNYDRTRQIGSALHDAKVKGAFQ